MASGSSETLLEVVIAGETYGLLSVPEASSALVRKQKDGFSSSYIEHMGHVGHFIKIAYNGANAAGHRFTDLQIDIQRLGYDIAKLCNEFSATIDRFQVTASTMSSRLQSVYQFLLDGFEDAAIMSVSSLRKLAEEMTKIACMLKEKFEMQEKKVEATLEITMKMKKSNESKRKEQLEKEQKEMEQKAQAQKELVDRYDQLAREAKEKRMEYERKEERAIDAILTVAFPFSAEAIDDTLKDKRVSTEKAKRLGEIAKEKREIELQKQNHHHETLQKMHEFATKLKNLTSEAEKADVVIEALHKTAQDGVHHLSVIMMEASKFWAHIRDHCNSLSDENFKDLMMLYALKDEETRKKFWRSEGFIKQAVLYHSRWVALQSICEEHKKLIDATRADLYEYIQENPTHEQSLQCLPQLTQNFIESK